MNSKSINVYDNEDVIRLKNELNQMYVKYDEVVAKLIMSECDRRINLLTGLPNAEKFEEIVNRRLSKGQYGTLFIFDVSEFSLINQEHGYEAGNSVISSIGEKLKFEDDIHAISGYLGGNRFCVYNIYALSNENAYEFFSLIRAKIDSVLKKYIPLKVRCVVTPLSKGSGHLRDIYINSEVMLKKLKVKKADFLFYDKSYQQIETSKDELAKFVKESVKLENYFLVYQEKVDSVTNKVVGLEALARLRRNDRIISPNVFIPILEGTGAIIDFGNMIIESVFKDMKMIQKKYGDDIVVSINVSPKQFNNYELKSWLEMTAVKYSVNLSQIELEITENVFVNDLDNCIKQILYLKEKGVKFALDDFGTGYSSLQYVTMLPVNTLKIDKKFIDQIYHDKTKIVVKAIIDIGHASNLSIVAEGVEDKRQVDILNSIGCNIIQGYFYSKPKLLD